MSNTLGSTSSPSGSSSSGALSPTSATITPSPAQITAPLQGGQSFLFAEDEGIKQTLQNLSPLETPQGSVSVPVFFRYPSYEIRVTTYPAIWIDLVDITLEADRSHRSGWRDYDPTEYWVPPNILMTNPLPVTVGGFDYPIPISLTYQVSAATRTPQMDRQLQALLMQQVWPPFFGAIYCPMDGSMRRLDFVRMRAADRVDTDQKRIFIKQYVVNVSSEYYLSQILAATQALSLDFSFELFDGEISSGSSPSLTETSTT